MKIILSDLLSIIDPLTVVEINKNGDRIIFKGRTKDFKNFEDMTAYNIEPNSTSREVYLEIDVY